jgi:hypothetical protein
MEEKYITKWARLQALFLFCQDFLLNPPVSSPNPFRFEQTNPHIGSYRIARLHTWHT